MFVENKSFDKNEVLKTPFDVHKSIFETFYRIMRNHDWKDYFFSDDFNINEVYDELRKSTDDYLNVIEKINLDTQITILNHYIHLYYSNRNVYYVKTRIFEYREALIQLDILFKDIKQHTELNRTRIDLIKSISRFIPISSI